jgi:anaerobic selenocysteine-containing dehydrogenase
MPEGSQKFLFVAGFISTRSGDPERGPMVRLNPADARLRLLEDGELVWVYGPRRQELAVLEVDERVPLGNVVARDIVGVSPTEKVRVVKPDVDAPRTTRHLG